MFQLLNVLVDICLLRRGPQALPPSSALTALSVVAYGALVTLSEVLLDEAGGNPQWGLVAMVLVAVSLYALLALRGYAARFRQTLTAVAGCGALYLALFLLLTASLDLPEGAAPTALQSLLLLVWVVLFFYGFVIEGSIYRHALAISLPAGVLLAALLYGLATLVYRGLYGSGP